MTLTSQPLDYSDNSFVLQVEEEEEIIIESDPNTLSSQKDDHSSPLSSTPENSPSRPETPILEEQPQLQTETETVPTPTISTPTPEAKKISREERAKILSPGDILKRYYQHQQIQIGKSDLYRCLYDPIIFANFRKHQLETFSEETLDFFKLVDRFRIEFTPTLPCYM